MTLWTAEEAAKATGGKAFGSWGATGVSIDTRTLRRGDLFVALRAARDGHEFVAAALEKGAAAALVSHRPDNVAHDAPLLIVDNVQAGLEALGRAARARTTARVVAVTGSVGKTSTKEMLRTVLSSFGTTHAAEASYNNHWGVPLTLARMPRDAAFAVIEIGMNHPGEIAPLSLLARPHVAMVTTVAPAHLEAFDDISGIAREKASIVEGLEPGGTAVLNADVDTAGVLRHAARACGARVLGFGLSGTAEAVVEIEEAAESATVARVTIGGRQVLYKIASAGAHFAMNGAAVLATVSVLGLDLAIAKAALGRWQPVDGRGARQGIVLDRAEPEARIELIDDSYNANPASVAASLAVLSVAKSKGRERSLAQSRRIAILGDMKELGPTGARLHAELADCPAIRDRSIDRVHCVGPLMRHLWEALPQGTRGEWAESATEMADAVRSDLRAGDVVLVKGSLSMGLAVVVDAIRKMDQSTAD